MTADRNEMHEWADGRLDGERLRRFEARLDEDPALRAEAHSWRRQAEALSELGVGTLDEPVPQRLIDAARGRRFGGVAPRIDDTTDDTMDDAMEAAGVGLRAADPRVWLAAAALAAVAFSGGWLSHA